MSGTVEAIWLKSSHRGPMRPVERADALAHRGLAGNANQGGRRQVTLLAAEAWERASAELGQTLDPGLRRANVLLRGIELADSRSRVLLVGTVPLLIRGETLPCRRMDRACAGLRRKLREEWRGGAYGEVLGSGSIAVGDAARWADEDETLAVLAAANS